MEAARANWRDSRLDDLNARVKSMDAKMDAGFARLDDRIDKLQHTMVQAFVALISIVTVLPAAFLAVVATHF
jgi:hypothetical protein